jgi:hypothetical protein
MPNTQTSVPLYASGEVLTAANLNLTNSGIPVFATTVTRDAAFGGANEKVLAEGQFAYIEATNTTQYYDGAAWQAVGASSGLTLVATATPTAVASVSINNCFTSTYENYRILISTTAGVGSTAAMTFRLRASSTDTTANYSSQLLESYSTTVATSANASGTDDWFFGNFNPTTADYSSAYDIFRPQTAQKTGFIGQSTHTAAGSIFVNMFTSGVQNSSTQFDGLTLLFASTSFTGTIRVYGYANS